jgi:predicted NBD/HSP70 family sugar kinase
VSSDRLTTHFEERAQRPRVVLNNPQASAFAQAMRLPSHARFVHVFIGLGLGVTFVNHRRISSDIWPHGGELGHVVYQGQTLNSKLSVARLRQSLRHELSEGSLERDTERLWADKPAAFDPWLNEAAPILNFLANFVENAIWPDAITVGGFLPPSLLEALVTRTHPLYDSVVAASGDTRRILPRLVHTDQGASSIAQGAAVSVLSASQNPGFAKLIASRRARKMERSQS